MRNKAVYAPLIHLFTGTSVIAGDIQTTEWPMFGQNAAHTNYLDVQLTPANFKFDWKIKLGASDSIMTITTPLVITKEGIYTIVRNDISPMAMDIRYLLQKLSTTNGDVTWSKSFKFEVAPTSHKHLIFLLLQFLHGDFLAPC